MKLKKKEINEFYNKLNTTNNEIENELNWKFNRNKENFGAEGLSSEAEIFFQNQREARLNIRRNPADPSTREIYKTISKRVKYEVSLHKWELLHQKLSIWKMIMQKSNRINFFKIVSKLEEKPQQWLNVVLEKSCNKQFSNNKVLKIWKGYWILKFYYMPKKPKITWFS